MKTKIRILHIDDNLLDRQIVKNILQKEADEFEVIEAESGPEFELHLNENDFELILSEFNIPGLEGLNVLQIVKAKKLEIPVIIVTGKGSEEIAVEAMKLGAADYVIKSEKHIQNLSPTIKRVIENRKIQDDHKALLTALRKSEDRFRLLFNNSMDAIFLNIPEGAILEANTVACAIFGRTEEELKQVGRNGIIDFADPRLAILLEERSRSGKCTGELTGLRNDGTPFPIEISSALFQDNDGNLQSSMVIRDITMRNQMEESLQESEKLYRNLFESMLNGFAYCKMLYEKKRPQDFIYLKVNKAFETLTGLSNVDGKKVSEVIPGIRESDAELFEIYARVALTGKPETFEFYVKAQKLWYLISVYSPQKEYFVAIFDVITKRKLADEALIASEIRYRRLFESAQDGILILDAESGMIADVNPYLVKLLGYSTEQFHGKKIWEIGIFSDLIENHDKFLELQQKEYVRYDDLPLKTKDGRQIAVEFVSNVYEVNHQKVIQCNIRDNTDRSNKQNEIKFQSELINNVGQAVIATDLLGNVTYWNNAAEKIYGWSTAEAIGQNIINLTPAEQSNEQAIDIMNKLSKGKTWAGEFYVKRKDGSSFPAFVTDTPILDSNEKLTGIIGISSDITERKQASEALLESEQLLSKTQQFAHIGSFNYLFNSNEIKWSDEMYNIMGLQKDTFIVTPESFINCIHPEDRTSMLNWIARTSNGINLDELDFRIIKPDGTIRNIIGNGILQNDKEGKMLQIIGSAQDITERIKIENALKESEVKFRSLMENSADAIFITDPIGKYIYTNKAVTDLLGYSSKEMLGKSITDLAPADKIEYYFEILSEILSKGKAFAEIELIKKDGKIVSTDLNSVLLPDGTVYGSCRDITVRKQAEAEIRNLNESLELKVEERTEKLSNANTNLIEAKAQAEHSNQAKSEFLSNMSHEIRTPMNAILGYAELLSNVLEDKTQKEYLKSIMSSGKTLLKLINDILDLSKIEAGKLELTFDYVNTNSFFPDIARIFSWMVAEKGLIFILDIDSGVPAGICVDETRLRQIMLNIISNAVKFTQKGHIKLKVYVENPQVVKLSNDKSEELVDLVIEIEDTGIGISRKFQNHIFEPFSQEQHKNQFGGTGLGLSITKRLLDLMNGTIHVQSKSKKGSTFQIKIPGIIFIHDHEKKTENNHINPAYIEFEKATILIVDDIAHNRKYLADALQNTSIEIVEAEDGLTGYRLAKKRAPDLIICDLRMPKLDGFGMLKKIQGNVKLSHIPVIAYSASAMKEQREEVLKSKFSGLLVKPVLVTDLYIELMNFLPYKRLKTPKEDRPSERELLKQINDIQGLAHSLETVYSDSWKRLELRQPLDEVKEFGGNIEHLGETHNAEIIKKYGHELMTAAENFDIDSILKLLNKYQGIVNEIIEYKSIN